MQIEIVRKMPKNDHFNISKTKELKKKAIYVTKFTYIVRNEPVAVVISNCINCILQNKKSSTLMTFMNPILKENTP